MALNPHGVPRWNPDADEDGALPAGSYAQEVAEMLPADRRVLARTVGPAVKYAAFGVFLHFLLWLLTPLAEFALATCPEDGEQGVVVIPLDFLTLIGYLLLFAPLHLYCQCKCMQYVIIPQLEVTQRFTFMDLIPVSRFSYWTWLTIYCALTCGATLNTLTNGQILGRTMATYACGAPYTQIEVTWQSIMNEAIIHEIPGFRHSSFLRMSLCAYAIQLATPIFAWIYARPNHPEHIFYVPGNEVTYKTPYNRNMPTNHGAVLMVLGSLARFEAVTFQDVTFATHRMTELFKERSAQWQRYYLQIARTELDRAIARFTIIGLLQDVVQTNLQTTVVGIDWFVAGKNRQQRQAFGGGIDLQMFFSVILCFLSTLADIVDAVDVVKIGVRVLRCFPVGMDWELREDGDRRLVRHIRKKLVRFAIYYAIFISMSVWSFAKLVALFVCKNHIWNIHPWELLFDASFEQGCA